MGSYTSSYSNGSAGVVGDQVEVPSAVLAEFPALAAVLAGCYDVDGAVCLVPPASVIIFAELGKVKFCLHPKRGDKVAFGTLTNPERGFSALEEEIAALNFEWKRSKR